MAKLASSSTSALDFLRRLLCAHSASNADDSAAAQHGATRDPAPEPEARSPCIVARLMGLDAMPADAPHGHPQPLRRSRYASSAEGWPPPPPCSGDATPQPLAMQASTSLREKQAYLRQENDEFLLLSFSPEDRSDVKGESFSLAAAETTGRGERRSDRAKKQGRNGQRRRKLQFSDQAAECDMQNASPVSVLEARDGHEESSTTTTSSSMEEVENAELCSASSVTVEETQSILKQQSSGRKLRSNFDQIDDLSHATSTCHATRCSDRERRNRRVVNKAEVITPDVTGIWQPICRMVEEDLKNMDWFTRDGANVVAEMESGILDQLLCEATDELLQLSSDVVCALPLRSSLEVPVSKKCSGKTIKWRYPCLRNVQARQAIGGY
ncbi:uncharacterized protein LOC133885560 [Phragmites australis]|uniref:uncharacterized protein LOC133885560 n=1 Tax=Phragmites australis TaxID=29695 RepID=UPI002D792030|nr:uncharacterized protein LOC133885560 [Phragmites australis]